MNVSEFKAWFEGYLTGMVTDHGYPNQQQWKAIAKKVSELEDFTPTVTSNWPSTDTVTQVPIGGHIVSYTDGTTRSPIMDNVNASGAGSINREVPHHVHTVPYLNTIREPDQDKYGGSSEDESSVGWKNNSGV